MIDFNALILRFASKGEKTGWTYVEVPADLAHQLQPDSKQSFRVKGLLDNYAIRGVALVPMGEGNYILPLNGAFRKGIRKGEGALLQVKLEVDHEFKLDPPDDLVACLEDVPGTIEQFYKQPGSHQRYFTKWIESAKTEETRVKRIAHTVEAMVKKLNYAEMIRSLKVSR